MAQLVIIWRCMELPTPSTTLFGREHELQQIAQHLDEPDHRLVTLVGPGGIGKTRLGLEAARRYGDRTKDGAVFIDLQPIEDADLVVQALADSINLSIQNKEMGIEQIARFLEGKETLLFFDNFEQVIDAATVIGRLLDMSPGTTALVTSRSPLRISQEWLLHVDGLPVPRANRPRSSAESASMLLFLDRARQVRPDLSIEREQAAIEQICRLADGMPLAIEIAASWTRVLDCSEIASEIERSRQFLASGMRDVPERHRSIEAIFDQAMQMLVEHEQQVFDRLSVFRGGFTRGAAETVAGANLAVLSSLVDRSLIRATADGRYRIHELVRQFGADKLAKNEDEQAAAEAAHSSYYMKMLSDLHHDIAVSRQLETANMLDPERENINVAWRYAVKHVHADSVSSATDAMGMFIQYRGRYAVGGQVFSAAIERFRQAEQTAQVQRALAYMLVQNGWFNLRQGRLDASEESLIESQELHDKLGMIPMKGFGMDPELARAYVTSTRGDIAGAVQLANEGLERAIEQDNVQHRALAHQLLGHLAIRQGDLKTGRDHVQQALTACHELEEKWFIGYCHNELGEVEVAEGNHEEANQHFRSSLAISDEFGDRASIGLSQVYLGEVATLTRNFEEARRYFDESKEAYRQLGDRGGVARADSGLGVLAVAVANYPTASKHLRAVLDAAVDMDFVAMILDAIAGIGELGLKTDQKESGRKLLSFALGHPSSESRTRTRVRLISATEKLDPETPGTLEEHVELARQLLDGYSPMAGQTSPGSDANSPAAGSNQPLPDPLTERELEVLGMIAQGMPNKQIADDLIVSLGTVKWHSNQIYTKLGVHNRTGAVAKAHDLGLLTAND